MRATLLTAVLLIGCARKRADAPEDMESIARFLYQGFDDDRAVEDGLENLVDWMLVNMDTEEAQRGYRLTQLTEEDTAGVQHPGEPHEELLGAAVVGVSPYGLQTHARTMVLPDQVYMNPGNLDYYDRAVDGDDDGFVGGVGRIDTTNDVQTVSFGIRIPYLLFKDYRWIESDFGQAIIARHWIAASGCNAGGDNCLIQNFGEDIWIDLDSRTDTLRFTATWSEVDSPAQAFITEQMQIGALANGMVRVYENTDAFIADSGLASQ